MDVKQGSNVVDRNGEPIGRVAGFVNHGPHGEPSHVVVADDERPGRRIAIVMADITSTGDDTARLALTRDDIARLEAARTVAGDGQSGLVPEDPIDVGLEPVEVDITEVEPVHEIANQAREDLRKLGFTDTEIDDWARQFVAHHGPGDEAEFIAWIRAQEHAT
jgi:hypothetical protein